MPFKKQQFVGSKKEVEDKKAVSKKVVVSDTSSVNSTYLITNFRMMIQMIQKK